MLANYFRRISNYTTFRFILEVTALTFISRFIIVLPIVLILTTLGVDVGEANIDNLDLQNKFLETIFFAVVIAPFLETLIFQFLPLKLFKLLRIPIELSIFITTLIFAYVHLDDGLINFIGMLPIGFLFVWSFVVRDKRSTYNAIFTVFVIHALTNLLATVIYLLGK